MTGKNVADALAFATPPAVWYGSLPDYLAMIAAALSIVWLLVRLYDRFYGRGK